MKRSCFSISQEFGRPTNVPVPAMVHAEMAQPANPSMMVMAVALATLTFWIVWLV